MSAIQLNNTVREALRRLVEQYGPELVRDRARLAGLLRDECAEHKREVNLLLDALDEHVVETLRSPSQVLLLVTIPSCARRLHEARGTEATAAQWAVESWAHALGLLGEAGKPNDVPADESTAGSRESERAARGDDLRKGDQVRGRALRVLGNRAPWIVAGVLLVLATYLGWQAMRQGPVPVHNPTTVGQPPPAAPPSAPPEASPPVVQQGAVDPRLMGSWRTHFTNQHGRWTFVFTPQLDGRYRTTTSGPFPWPDDVGTIEARDGRWQARKGNGEREGGTYEFRNERTVVFKGHGPAVTWERIE
jgi:hypothetical protein